MPNLRSNEKHEVKDIAWQDMKFCDCIVKCCDFNDGSKRCSNRSCKHKCAYCAMNKEDYIMGILPDAYNCGLRMCWECRDCFPRHRAVMHVGIANRHWRGKRSWDSRRMHNTQFYVSDKRPMLGLLRYQGRFSIHWLRSCENENFKPMGEYIQQSVLMSLEIRYVAWLVHKVKARYRIHRRFLNQWNLFAFMWGISIS